MDNDSQPDNVALTLEDYGSVKLLKPIRVPIRVYDAFTKVIPFRLGYSPMMVNLMIFYLHNREVVNAFLSNLPADTGQQRGE